jgi:hypothetical protein
MAERMIGRIRVQTEDNTPDGTDLALAHAVPAG